MTQLNSTHRPCLVEPICTYMIMKFFFFRATLVQTPGKSSLDINFSIFLNLKAVARLNHVHTIPNYLLHVCKWVSSTLECW